MKRLKRNAGFTLIEVLTVIAIIGIMMGLVLGISGYATRKADYSRATAELEQIKNALEEYRIEYGRYPNNTDADDSRNLTDALWGKPHDDGIPPFLALDEWDDENERYRLLDPWGNDYRYYHDSDGTPFYAEHNNSRLGYDLWSLGVDIREDDGSNDDIANWRGDF